MAAWYVLYDYHDNILCQNTTVVYCTNTTDHTEQIEPVQSPGPENDFLYAADYPHQDLKKNTCENCDLRRLEPRGRQRGDVKIHYGTIGSGDVVLKDATGFCVLKWKPQE